MFRLKENGDNHNHDLIDQIIHQEVQTTEEVDPNILLDFWFETKEHLEKIEMNVLALENDPRNMEIVHGLLRDFHTIKGLAGFVNYGLIQRIAHQIETRLDDCRNGAQAANREVIDLILTSSDYIKRFCEDPSLINNQAYTYAIETYLNKVDIINSGLSLDEAPHSSLPGPLNPAPNPETAIPGAEGSPIVNGVSENTGSAITLARDINPAMNIASVINIATATPVAEDNTVAEITNVAQTTDVDKTANITPAKFIDEATFIDEAILVAEATFLEEAANVVEAIEFTPSTTIDTPVDDTALDIRDAVKEALVDSALTDSTLTQSTEADSPLTDSTEAGSTVDQSTETKSALGEVESPVEQTQAPDESLSIIAENEAEYLKAFIEETQNYLDIFEQGLLQYEKEPGNKDIVNELFRSMHTIKGMASAMGFINLTALSHGIENLLQDLRDDHITPNPNLIELLYLGHDHLTNSLQLVRQTGNEAGPEQDGLLEKLHEILTQLRETRTGAGVMDTETPPVAADETPQLPGLGIDPAFFQETMTGIMEWVTKVELKLLLLETATEDPTLSLAICEYFLIINRLAHLVAAKQIQNIARQAAVLLKKCASGDEPMGRKIVDWLLQSTEYLKKLGVEFQLNEDPEFVRAVTSHLSQFPAFPPELAEVDRAALEGTPIQKLGNILIEQEKLTLAEVTELLARQKADAPELRLGQIGVKEGILELEELRESLKVQQESMINLKPENQSDPFATFRKVYGLDVTPAKPLKSVEPIGQVLVSHNIICQDELDQLLVQQKEVHPGLKLGQVAVAEKKAEAKEIIQSLRAQEHELKTIPTESDNVRVSITKVDNLVDLVGELLIIQSLIEQEAGKRFDSNDYFITNLTRMARITKDIQNMSMSLRMISLKSTFQKINRVARDAITQLGKNISFQMSGEETEIDRGVAEKILDPLIHLVKNAVSHGIESETVRTSLRKPAQGLVKVEASSKRGYIFIDVSDDGKGMDIDAIHQKALEKKLIEPGGNYTTDEILNLVFLPGFSTAQTIDNISGRGVGLDVVKTEMQKIGGKVEINSNPGQGTLFTLKIPINFAVFNGIIISIQEMNFIIPTQNVRRIVQIKPDQWVQSNTKKMITIRDEAYSVIPIFKALGLKNTESANLVVILELDQKLKALPVHGIVGKREIVLKPLGNEFSNLYWIAGASILGDGKVSLILDVENIFKMMEEDVG